MQAARTESKAAARSERHPAKGSTSVRSGAHISRQDMVDGSGGIVINLSELGDITVKESVVSVEAAATSEALAEQLSEHGLALPIADNPLKSVASSVLNEGVSNLMRSLGALSDYVTKVSAVKPDGTPTTLKAGAEVSCLDQCLASKAVITEVAFNAVSAKKPLDAALHQPLSWMRRFSQSRPGLVPKHRHTR